MDHLRKAVPGQRQRASTCTSLTSCSASASHHRQSSTTSSSSSPEAVLPVVPALVPNNKSFRRRSTKKRNQKFDAPPSVIIPPAPSVEPILLLEGDEYCLSPDGVATTRYELNVRTEVLGQQSSAVIEEIYDLERAHKTFFLQSGGGSGSLSHTNTAAGTSFPLEIQEIPSCNGLLGKAGTGATTWEASIAMALCFSLQPNLLKGNVIELGSGVGLGGILSATYASHYSELQSWTMTDGNSQVLQHCRQNLNRLLLTSSSAPSSSTAHDLPHLSVAKLDWNEVSLEHVQQYDTVVACDCAYLYSDIDILASTMISLIKPGSNSRIHIFGPNNRGALQELVQHLKKQPSLDVTVHTLTLTRHRLRPQVGWTYEAHQENMLHSQSSILTPFSDENHDHPTSRTSTATFLHATVSFSTEKEKKGSTKKQSSLTDID